MHSGARNRLGRGSVNPYAGFCRGELRRRLLRCNQCGGCRNPDDANNKALHFKSDCPSPGNAWARVFGNGNSEKPLKAGSTYSLTYRVYLKSNGKDANGNVKRAIINAQYSDNNVGQWADGRTIINQYFTSEAKIGEWVTTTVNFTATKDAYLVFYVANDGGTGYSIYSDFYIDDVVLKEVTETTVTFNSNGGSNCAGITAFSGAALTLPTPTKEGSDFLGWYEDVALTKGYVSAYQPENDITLYAKWDVVGDGVWEQDFENYILTSSNNKRLQSETVYAGNYALQRFEVKNEAGVSQPNSFVPLFPRSTEKVQVGKKYTLTFKYKSASNNPFNLYLVSNRTTETNQGTAALSFSAAAAANWTEITKTVDLTDSSKFTTNNYLCLYSWGTAEYFLDDIRLVESAPVTITYVTNNSTTVESMTDYPGAALTLPTPNSDTLGQVFGGWYTDEALTNQFTAAVYPATSTMLYAKWTKPGWTQDFESFKDEYNTNYSNVIISGIADHDLITVADREADDVTSGKRSIRYSYDSEVDGGTASGDNRIVINAAGDRNALCDYFTKAGDILKVSFKYKVTTGAPKLTVQTGYDDLKNAWAASSKSGIAQNETALAGNAGEWQTFTKSFTVNPDSSISRVKTLVFILSGAGEVYIDDVEALVVPTGVETAYNNKAAIRAADETANVKQGFRLYNKVNKQWLEDYNIVEFGALAIRKGRLAEGAALNASTENAAKGVAWVKDGEYKLWEDLGDSYTFTAVLIGIREKFYAEDYSVVTYAKDKDGNYIYGEVQDLCVYDVVDSHFKLLPIFQQMHEVYVNDGIACHFKCYELFWQLSYQLKMLTTKNNLKSEYNKIYKGILYLEQHFTQEVGPDELAEMCGLSVCYFRRLFRQYKDMSPVKYCNLLRMKKARELLESGDYTVAEASDAVGCTDVFYFSKQFKSVFGINASDCKPRPHIEKQHLQNA